MARTNSSFIATFIMDKSSDVDTVFVSKLLEGAPSNLNMMMKLPSTSASLVVLPTSVFC
jgi:hypothetical protein